MRKKLYAIDMLLVLDNYYTDIFMKRVYIPLKDSVH